MRADDRSVYGKKVRKGLLTYRYDLILTYVSYNEKGASGAVIVKTTQAILIALYDDKIQPGNCTKVTEGLADYLISVGFVSFLVFS